MNRRKFLQNLGIGTVGVITIPSLILEPEKEYPKYIAGCDIGHKSGDYHHIVIAKRYQSATVYIDGKKQDEKTFLIDEMTVWNRQLTDEEIKTLYYRTVALKENQSICFWT